MSPRIVLLGGLSSACASALRRALPADGNWDVRAVPDAAGVARALASGPPPVFVVLDAVALAPANLPALCRSVRRAVPSPSAVRLEVLLPELSPAAVRAVYAAGADECRHGPVSARTLSLFVLAKAPPPPAAAADAFRFDSAAGVARLGGRPLDLTASEVRLLRALVAKPGIALSRKELLCESLGAEAASVQPRAVDSIVAHIRGKLGPVGWRLETAWGRGYRWNDASRPPLGVRLVRRRARVAGSGLLGILFAVLAARAPRPVPPAGPSADPPPSGPSASVARALLDAFGTDGPPAVGVARPKPPEKDGLSVFPMG